VDKEEVTPLGEEVRGKLEDFYIRPSTLLKTELGIIEVI
jgi:hypothetical protein